MNSHARELVRILLSQFTAEKSICGAEIGVAEGEMSAYLLTHLPTLILHMVDSWEVHDPNSAYYRSGDRRARLDLVEQTASMHLAKARTDFAAERRTIIQSSSKSAADRFAEASLDFIFIDADHTYDAVRDDIWAWRPKLRPGGLLSGHDYGARRDLKGIWGVQRAVDEFCLQERLELRRAGHGVWWIPVSA